DEQDSPFEFTRIALEGTDALAASTNLTEKLLGEMVNGKVGWRCLRSEVLEEGKNHLQKHDGLLLRAVGNLLNVLKQLLNVEKRRKRDHLLRPLIHEKNGADPAVGMATAFHRSEFGSFAHK